MQPYVERQQVSWAVGHQHKQAVWTGRGSFRYRISQLTFDRTIDRAKKSSSLCKSFTKTGTLHLLSLNGVIVLSMW